MDKISIEAETESDGVLPVSCALKTNEETFNGDDRNHTVCYTDMAFLVSFHYRLCK